MSYQVLARKWRPRSFQDMVGQEHVLQALTNALDTERLHHGYLFTGTRGVGKTTLARILTKCLNCEKGVTSTPCNECSACTGIDAGRFVDLIEVDAASRAKVDETRDLMENVQYTPAAGRYKVYLIDEVHMFSGHSFNALLKTLEEPPPHVKFLLATTEAKKIPVTILSRCLQFNLKHLSVGQIDQQLVKILQAEDIKFEAPATRLVAAAAKGSMRDALSILDQAISYGQGELQEQQVSTMLGVLKQDYMFDLLNDIIADKPVEVLQRVDTMAETAPDYDSVLGEMLSILHQIAVAQVLPPETDTIDEVIAAYRDRLSPEDVQLYYQIVLNGRKDLYSIPDPRMGFEMTVIRMLAFHPLRAVQGGGAEPSPGAGKKAGAAAAPARPARAPARPAATQAQAKPAPAKPQSAPAPAQPEQASAQSAPAPAQPEPASAQSAPAPAQSAPAPAQAEPTPTQSAATTTQPEPTPADTAPAPIPPTTGDSAEDWYQMIDQMGLSGLVKEVATHCFLKEHSQDKIHLVLRPEQEHLLKSAQRQRLQEAIKAHYGEQVKLLVTVEEAGEETPAQMESRKAREGKQAAMQAIEDDPEAQKILDIFNGTVDTEATQLQAQNQERP
ncbi:MAG: DNA polymerase III subunit gamma/tau [Gammaproteobacteria bacterium]